MHMSRTDFFPEKGYSKCKYSCSI